MTEINPDNPNEMEVSFNSGGFIDIKTSTVVKLNEKLVVHSEDGPIQLSVNITADFNTIDEKYHEVFFNFLSAKYLNRVSFGDNPFSECKPVQKRKWWQFWKSKYFV
jgi:hypothetical protein